MTGTKHAPAAFSFGAPVFLEAPGYHTAGGQRYLPLLDASGNTQALILADEGDPDTTPAFLEIAANTHDEARAALRDLVLVQGNNVAALKRAQAHGLTVLARMSGTPPDPAAQWQECPNCGADVPARDEGTPCPKCNAPGGPRGCSA